VPETRRQQIGRVGGLQSWANTPDRAERMRKPLEHSPASVDYWIAKLDPNKFSTATDEQKLAAADAMRRAHFARLALRSADARRRDGAA
jgi:hypothetical protein